MAVGTRLLLLLPPVTTFEAALFKRLVNADGRAVWDLGANGVRTCEGRPDRDGTYVGGDVTTTSLRPIFPRAVLTTSGGRQKTYQNGRQRPLEAV